jgi:hypothetical protein
MNRIKRYISVLLVFLFLLSAGTVVFARAESASLVANKSGVYFGGTVGITLTISGLSGPLECYGPVRIRYDSSLFTFNLDATKSAVQANSQDPGLSASRIAEIIL